MRRARPSEGVPLFISAWSAYYTGTNPAVSYALSPSIASAAWPAANRAFACPLYLDFDYPMQRMWWVNGSTAAGNVDIGIYDARNNLLLSSGATAQAGTSAFQYVTKQALLRRGAYWLALSLSSTSGTLQRSNTLSTAVLRLSGYAQMASAHPLPATLVPAAMASTFFPCFGITTSPSGF